MPRTHLLWCCLNTFWYTVFINVHISVIICIPLCFGWLLVPFFIRKIVYQFLYVFFLLHIACSFREGWDPVNRFNHTSLVAVVTQTECPNSARNRCVIEDLIAFLCNHVGCSCVCSCFCHRTCQVSSFLSWFPTVWEFTPTTEASTNIKSENGTLYREIRRWNKKRNLKGYSWVNGIQNMFLSNLK